MNVNTNQLRELYKPTDNSHLGSCLNEIDKLKSRLEELQATIDLTNQAVNTANSVLSSIDDTTKLADIAYSQQIEKAAALKLEAIQNERTRLERSKAGIIDNRFIQMLQDLKLCYEWKDKKKNKDAIFQHDNSEIDKAQEKWVELQERYLQ